MTINLAQGIEARVSNEVERLVVWAGRGIAGMSNPALGETPPCPVAMVSHETLNLPAPLAQEFVLWIERFDEYLPGDSKANAFDWQAFHAEGQRLARELANAVSEKFAVKYCDPNNKQQDQHKD